METLYQVLVVTKDREIIIDKKLVAKNHDDAKFNAGLYTVLKDKSLKPSDVTVLVESLGNVEVNKHQ